jgi:GNAT superfamily N-acetyltransferase
VVTTTYLEMLEPPRYPEPEFAAEVQILHCLQPSVDYYRFLYHQVGRDWAWKDRLGVPDEQLEEILNRPGSQLWVLFHAGHPAGYSELAGPEDEVQIQYFGLFPQYIGRGLGLPFLRWTVHRAWRSRPRRVWVHTCDLDHPNALPSYQKAGFVIYRVDQE